MAHKHLSARRMSRALLQLGENYGKLLSSIFVSLHPDRAACGDQHHRTADFHPLPALKQARKAAVTVECQSNMRQLNMALSLYLQDNNERFPRTGFALTPVDQRWIGFFDRGGYGYPSVFCPESYGDPHLGPSTALFSYAYNQALGHGDWGSYGTDTPLQLRGMNPSEVITFSESYGGYFWNSVYGQGAFCAMSMWTVPGGRLSEPHNKAGNLAYLDGHVETVPTEDLTYYDFMVVKY